MKRKIRIGAFETNSSSTHAICISKNDVNTNDLPSNVAFAHGEFGWEFRVLTDTWDKASYLYQAICDTSDSIDERQEKLNMISDMLGEESITCEFEPDRKNYWNDGGYIDHAYDLCDLIRELLSDKEKLFRYLFGASMIITGNDNSDEFSEYMYIDSDGWNYDYKPEFTDYEIYEKGN